MARQTSSNNAAEILKRMASPTLIDDWKNSKFKSSHKETKITKNNYDIEELPPEVWNIILNYITARESDVENQYIELVFISQVSKQINLLCYKLKRQLGIRSIKVKSNDIQSYFASKGYLELLQYAHENGYEWDSWTCVAAAYYGHLEILKYAHENGCEWNAETCIAAASSGQLEILKYAHENGCPWDSETCSAAAKNGHLACLKYAHKNGCKWNARTCSSAAKGGHLNMLKYARKNGCPWNSDTCALAAKNGHLACLKYAHENGCKWHEKTFALAASNGHLEVLKYMSNTAIPVVPAPRSQCLGVTKSGSHCRRAPTKGKSLCCLHSNN